MPGLFGSLISSLTFMRPSREVRKKNYGAFEIIPNDILLTLINYLTDSEQLILAAVSPGFKSLVQYHNKWKLKSSASLHNSTLIPLGFGFYEDPRSFVHQDDDALFSEKPDTSGNRLMFFYDVRQRNARFSAFLFKLMAGKTLIRDHHGWQGREKMVSVPVDTLIEHLTPEIIREILMMFGEKSKPVGINLKNLSTFIDATTISQHKNIPLPEWEKTFIDLYYAEKAVAYFIQRFLSKVFGKEALILSEHINPHNQKEWLIQLSLGKIDMSDVQLAQEKLKEIFALLLTADQMQFYHELLDLIKISIAANPPSRCTIL